MTAQPPIKEDKSVHEEMVRKSVLSTEQATDSAQTDSEKITRRDTLLQENDLTTPDGTENELPPPAYGEIYGEIRDDKNGLGTSAYITEDGRVNININQFNRRLSQIFIPALRDQIQSVQDSQPLPQPYIPPSLGGIHGLPPPPPLNIVIQVVGSRGDVQPFVALGKVLKETYGHRVRLATHPNFKNFVQENDLEFFSIGGDPSQLMAFMVQNPSLMPGVRSLLRGDVSQRRKDVSEYIQGCWRSCYEAGDGMDLYATEGDLSKAPGYVPGSEPAARPFVADCIIANPPSFAHVHCAEKLGIPLHIMFTMPYSPTQAFPHPLANIQSSNADPQLTNYISYAMIELLSWQGLGDIINRFRAKCLGLDPISLIWAPGMLYRLKIPHTYCWSSALIPKPKDWGPHISVSGFSFLNLASSYSPAGNLQEFIDAGPPPVYIGFGSIVLDDPDAMTELIFEVARKTGHRILLSKGWGGMGGDTLQVPDGVFMLGNVPHDWLFKHVSCVVHHGGAGTTAAGISAGRPTIVVPFFGDQPFWGAMVARAGAGPDPIPHKQLTADKLADAIDYCLRPESLERARELASKIEAEKGSDKAAQSFHQYLEVDQLRCTLAPSRPATWRIKRSQIRLSAFAACTLANAKLLDFNDLKLFRPREYHTDEGPWDPISGGAAACYRAFTGMAMGVAEVPSETIRPFHMPSGSSRRQSHDSQSTTAGKSKSSNIGGRSTLPTSPDQSQTSLNAHESQLSLSDTQASNSIAGSSSIPDTLQEGPGRTKSSLAKDRDMLRPTGMHTSRGLGRFVRSFVQAPMEISVGLTKGFHNFPKMWGDDTVRPQERVSDFKSGAVAAGKEFGYGWYDGVTGLVTQPWKGAQKEGAVGFVKGIGKGLGGFTTKPLAGFSGLLGHTMKGVHKEVQQLFRSNVQSHIVGSRVAQGYEEWLQSSDAEKEDVIDRWNMINKYLKEKRDPDELMHDILEDQRKERIDETETGGHRGHTAGSAQALSGNDRSADPESTIRHDGISQQSEESLGAAEINETIRMLIQKASRGGAQDDAHAERAIQDVVSQLQRQGHDNAGAQSEEEYLYKAIASSKFVPQQQTNDTLEHENQFKQVMTLSLNEQRIGCESDIPLDAEVAASGSSGVNRSYSHDPGHLAGTTQSDFEARQQRQSGGKTTQERNEEDIVMEYVKKQSLLEGHHRNKGKGPLKR